VTESHNIAFAMFFDNSAATAATTSDDGKNTAEPRRQDVIVGVIEAALQPLHPGNVLLRDLLKLHVLLNKSNADGVGVNELDDATARHIVDIIQNGCTYTLPANVDASHPPQGFGDAQFVSRKTLGNAAGAVTWEPVEDKVAIQLVKILYKEMVKLHEAEQSVKTASADGGTDGSPKKKSTTGDDEPSAEASPLSSNNTKPAAAFTPSMDDVVLVQRDEVDTHSPINRTGTTHLVAEIGRYLSRNKLWIRNSESRRAEAALSILDKMKESKVRVLEQSGTSDKIQLKEIDKASAAEFILFLLFDSILKKEDEIAKVHPLLEDRSYPADKFAEPSTTPVDTPTPHDVLFGRGGMTNQHPGNRRYRDVISLHRDDYKNALKTEKPHISRRIVRAIRCGDQPGRFLKKGEDGKWYDVGDHQAAEKTSQALREKTAEEKSTKGSSGEKKRPASTGASLPIAKRAASVARAVPQLTPLTPAEIEAMANRALPPITPPKIPPLEEYSTAARMVGKGNGKGKKKGAGSEKEVALGFTGNTKPVDEDGNILVTDSDILCGRGGMTNHHIGNRRYRDIIDKHKPKYHEVAKTHKPAVAKLIVKAIRTGDPPGRFLKKDEKTGKWFDIGDQKAAEKTSQALREKSDEERVEAKKERAAGTPTLSMYTNPQLYRATSEALRSIIRKDGDSSPSKSKDPEDDKKPSPSESDAVSV
jgi:hypothetical protein